MPGEISSDNWNQSDAETTRPTLSWFWLHWSPSNQDTWTFGPIESFFFMWKKFFGLCDKKSAILKYWEKELYLLLIKKPYLVISVLGVLFNVPEDVMAVSSAIVFDPPSPENWVGLRLTNSRASRLVKVSKVSMILGSLNLFSRSKQGLIYFASICLYISRILKSQFKLTQTKGPHHLQGSPWLRGQRQLVEN